MNRMVFIATAIFLASVVWWLGIPEPGSQHGAMRVCEDIVLWNPATRRLECVTQVP